MGNDSSSPEIPESAVQETDGDLQSCIRAITMSAFAAYAGVGTFVASIIAANGKDRFC